MTLKPEPDGRPFGADLLESSEAPLRGAGGASRPIPADADPDWWL